MADVCPLNFDEILEIIFKHLENNALLKCRSVCQQWNYWSTKLLSKTSPILYFETPNQARLCPRSERLTNSSSDGKDDDGILQQFAADNLPIQIEPDSFLDLVWKHRKNPKLGSLIFTKFRLNVQLNLRYYQDFLDIVGADVVYLKLSGYETLDGNLSELLSRMSNLQTLKIPYCQLILKQKFFHKDNSELQLFGLRKLSIKGIEGYFEIQSDFFDEFFKIAKRIESLSLSIVDYGEGHQDDDWEYVERRQNAAISNLVKILDSFGNYVDFSTYKNFKFEYLTKSMLAKLNSFSDKGLKIRQLKIGSIFREEGANNAQSFKQLLEKQKENLESLQFFRTWGESVSEEVLSFPNLPKLKCLEFGLDSQKFRPAECLVYQKQFPALTKLEITGNISPDHLDLFFSEAANVDSPCNSLKSLRPPKIFQYTYAKYLEICSKIFPSVTELDVRTPDEKELNFLWNAWPRLETLKLVLFHGEEGNNYNSDGEMEIDDEYLEPAFLQKSLFRQIRSARDYEPLKILPRTHKNDEGSGSSAQIEATSKNPSICNLKELKHLTIYCLSDVRSFRGGIFSDRIIYDGLIKMKQLKYLKICEHARFLDTNDPLLDATSDISGKAVSDLKKSLKGTTIDISSNTKSPIVLKLGDPESCEFMCEAKDLKKVTICAFEQFSL